MTSRHYLINFFLVLYASELSGFKFQRKNVCNSYMGYIFDINNDCYHSDDVLSPLTEIVERHIGHLERYQTTTEDGYILELFRMPRKNPKGVIILQHPLTSDSTIWVGLGNTSLAFLFYEKGFDVWLPNNRGTPYTKGHVNISSYDPKFWDYSFHEIGIYDYSTIITFIKGITKSSRIIFLGHSMGSTSSLIYASMKPEEAKNCVKLFINLAPVGYIRHTNTVNAAIYRIFLPILARIMKILGLGALLGNQELVDLCRQFLVWFPIKKLVNYLISGYFGWSPSQISLDILNLFPNVAFKTFAIKAVEHYAQIYNNGGDFRMYDYGKTKNLKLYGSEVPPEYPLENIQAPFYLFWGDRDAFAMSTHLTYQKMSKKAKRFGYRYLHNMNHIDPLCGKDRFKEVHSYMFAAIDEVLK